ncbi:hypothetical protein GCM10020216_046910 [Nonomuraea helvata]
MSSDDSCMSPHVPAAALDCASLHWSASRADERVRVYAWTCHHSGPIYELCASGGQWFIRRMSEGTVMETTRWLRRKAEAMWSALLTGQVR